MRAGRLNARVTIQQRNAGQDSYGQPVNTWADVATVWANVTDIKGREFLAAQASQSAVTTKILIRDLDGVDAAMRVVHGVDVYNIVAVLRHDDDGLLLMCERGVNNG